MKIQIYLLVIAILSLSACTWVDPTPGAKEVLLVKPYNVNNCKQLGAITTRVQNTIGPIVRDEEKVARELVTLGKNEAAERGGDSIVIKKPAKDGAMSFDVYKCAP